ncbi:MAG: hypothetical protein R3C61_28280 [Bacteroidia bacterium]
MKQKIEEKDREMTALTEKYETAKLVNSLQNGQDLLAVQAKIDDYIKEIDICLKNFGD